MEQRIPHQAQEELAVQAVVETALDLMEAQDHLELQTLVVVEVDQQILHQVATAVQAL